MPDTVTVGRSARFEGGSCSVGVGLAVTATASALASAAEVENFIVTMYENRNTRLKELETGRRAELESFYN